MEGNEEEGARHFLVVPTGQDWALGTNNNSYKKQTGNVTRTQKALHCECDQMLEQVLQRHHGVSNHVDTQNLSLNLQNIFLYNLA